MYNRKFGSNQILDLVIKDGSKDVKCQAIPYLISRDAISQKIEHVDFFRIQKAAAIKSFAIVAFLPIRILMQS